MNLHYMGRTSESIIDTPLAVCFYDNDVSELPDNLARDIIKGESTPLKPVANHFGTNYTDVLSFDIALVKIDESTFTDDEQRIINAWLSSPKLPQLAQFVKCFGGDVGYRGLFTNLIWQIANGGIIGVVCTFTADSPFEWVNANYQFTVNGSGTYYIDCDSDELEEYVYPVFTVLSKTTSQIEIKNISDHDNTMDIRALAALNMKFDCRYCKINDAITDNVISYADLGWTDVGNIYWLRLKAGMNELQITGNIVFTISFNVPHKKVGGWLC